LLQHPQPRLRWDLRSADLDEVRRRVSGLLKPFELLTYPNRAYNGSLLSRPLKRAAIAVIEYGDRVSLRTGALRDLALLQMPVRGSFRAGAGRFSAQVSGDCLQFVRPDAPIEMDWSPDCRALVVRFDDPDAISLLDACGACSRNADPRAPILIGLRQGAGQSLGRVLRMLREELADGRLFEAAGEHAEDLLLALAVLALEDAATMPRDSARHAALPVYVRRAEEFMEANLRADVGLAAIVKASGVSTRTLFHGFARVHGMGPMAWMRERRLGRTRAELLAADASQASVTEIALGWGFTHMGRFAATYKRRFGESPSQTLRR
jgi:AraC-like DNA-binding protein